MRENPKNEGMSRRNFTLTAALAAVAAALPSDVAAQQEKPAAGPPATKPPEPEGPKLSDAAKKEVELKVQWVMDRYGARLSEAQKADIRKAMASTQEGLEALRTFPIENWDEPATVLHFNDAQSTGVQR